MARNPISHHINAGQRHVPWAEGAGCKTVGYAFGGSNPPPATSCESGPLAADLRLCGPFCFIPLCHLGSLQGAVSRHPRTYSGPASEPLGRSVRTGGFFTDGHGRAALAAGFSA